VVVPNLDVGERGLRGRAHDKLAPEVTYRQSDGIEPFIDDPFPVFLGDPVIPMTLQCLLPSAFGYIKLDKAGSKYTAFQEALRLTYVT